MILDNRVCCHFPRSVRVEKFGNYCLLAGGEPLHIPKVIYCSSRGRYSTICYLPHTCSPLDSRPRKPPPSLQTLMDFKRKKKPFRYVSEGSENELILGYGRLGQIAHRLLHTQNIPATLIDHDGDHIEFIRQFDSRVFYGDATDIDLLRSAGAGMAKVIVISMDNTDHVLKAARICKEHFPQAKLVARARNRTHMFDLMALEVDFVERETARAALAMGRETLRFLGYEKDRSDRLMDAFLRYDFKMIEETWQHRDNLEKLIEEAADTRDFLRQTLGDIDSAEELEEVLETRLKQLRAEEPKP